MLKANDLVPLTDLERDLYTALVPENHFLRRLLELIDFERFRPGLEACYCGEQGRPAVDPVCMLKLEILARHYNLSDREVMAQTQVNVAFRLFVGLSLRSSLPHHTLLTYFRERVGTTQLQEIFHTLLGQARELGLVRDRLRLKDATHIIANIAIPSTIQLVAETREQLLGALQPFAPRQVEQEQQRAQAIHQASVDLKDQERLVRRVAHLQAILAWADAVPGQAAFHQAAAAEQERLHQALRVAHKVLADRDPEASDKLLSVQDVDARRGKHGDYYEGYLLDVAMDADSELITGVNVLPANGNEGADATHLIQQEEQAHGNDVEALSLDGAGFRGELLRELTDPQGLHLEVFVPPPAPPVIGVFGPEQFTLSDDGTTLTCPAGQTTNWRQPEDNGVRFIFAASACATCPLRQQCLSGPKVQRRSVSKNYYEAEYRAARAQAQTAAYAEVRQQHPAIERKLSELVRRHDVRHARYRGQPRVHRQGILTALVVNLKRMVRLLTGRLSHSVDPPLRTGILRLELAEAR
jgi:transposase